MRSKSCSSECDNLDSRIAIIGMSGRFPGARNLEEFRRNLEDGVESIRRLTDEELLRAGVSPDLLADPSYVKAAPVFDDADLFDAAFFDVAPREAKIMDPQQRLFLECAWEAVEDAGHAGDLSGRAVGVFAGAGGMMSTYVLSDRHFNPNLVGTTASMEHIGNDKDYLSTRVSYKFDLRGPSYTVQTACSTSLVAVHLACQSLLHQECEMAIAGGTTVRVPQGIGYLYREGNVFSPDGHCRAFDAAAGGTVFGSGVGAVLLKRFTDAVADGDPIHAVILGSAINNDGATKSSYWAPSVEGQAKAMKMALEAASIDPQTIRYVEAHGTATIQGDPTEILALRQAFGAIPGFRCAVGSVKSNIGHPESAAGVAGLIKAVLSLKHKKLFPTLHFSKLNPGIEDSGSSFYICSELSSWSERSCPRRAAVNSLGIGGTNAFVILEEAPDTAVASAQSEVGGGHLLTLSAKSPEAMRELADRFSTHFRHRTRESFADACYTTQVGRRHFEHRMAVVAESGAEAARRLEAVEQSPGQVVAGTVSEGKIAKVAFLFTGQGSQFANMGHQLYQSRPVFRETVDQCSEILRDELTRPLLDVLYPQAADDAAIHQTAFTQPALFTFEFALAKLWQSFGIQPSVMIGHSVGEYVAACLAGVMSLRDSLRVIAARGRLMQALPSGGGMVAVRCDASRVHQAIAPFEGSVSIAAYNGPSNTVISGRTDALKSVLSALALDQSEVSWLEVSHAFHSPLMTPMLAEFEREMSSVSLKPPSLPFISNVNGKIAGDEVANSTYWVEHVCRPVRFFEGMQVLGRHEVDVLLEIGPKPTLLAMGGQCIPKGDRAWIASLHPRHSDLRQLNEAAAAMFVRGGSMDWDAFHRGGEHRRVHLPTYPFQRKRFWMEPPSAATRPMDVVASPLLGRRLRLPNSSETRFEAEWSPSSPPYLDDHRIYSQVVVPGASHLALVLSAAHQLSGDGEYLIEDVVFPHALTLSDGKSRPAQLIISPSQESDNETKQFQVVSLRDKSDAADPDAWVEHANGKLAASHVGRSNFADRSVGEFSSARIPPRIDVSEVTRRCPRRSSGDDFYSRFWEAGYHLGPSFRWISEIWAGKDEVLCRMDWPDLPDDPEQYPLYPSLIDACFQFVFSDKAQQALKPGSVFVPFSIGSLQLFRSPTPGRPLWCHASVADPEESGSNRLNAHISLYDDEGQAIARISDCQLREASKDALTADLNSLLQDSAYEVSWEPMGSDRESVTASTADTGSWIIFVESTGDRGNRIVEKLRSSGQRCLRVSPGAKFHRLGADEYEIDPFEPDHFRRLIQETSSDVRCRGVVDLWGLDARPDRCSDPSVQKLVCGTALHLIQALARTEWASFPRLWFATLGVQPVDPNPTYLNLSQCCLAGLTRVIAMEHPEFESTCIDFDPSARSGETDLFVEDLLVPTQEKEIAYRDGRRLAPRLVKAASFGRPDSVPNSGPGAFQIKLAQYGQFEKLERSPFRRRSPGPGEVEVEVRASGLNFRDVLNALGMLQEHYAEKFGVTSATEMTFGFECSGVVSAIGPGVTDVVVGDEVIGAAVHDALASHTTLRQEFVVRKPPSLSFDEAATIPLPFLTAYYGLQKLAKIQPGDRVLIHSAAGGVGQAAVQVALAVGAEVFATASPAKWDYLRSAGIKHVMNSRTLDFASEIYRETQGEGVDVVLNTLGGDFVDASFEALRTGGRFVELGKLNVWSREEQMSRRPDVSYFPFDLVDISEREPSLIKSMLEELMARVADGDLKPLPHRVYAVDAVADAFRHMAEARHIGKIVIAMPWVGDEKSDGPSIKDDATYLVTGGLGALGSEVSKWLIAQGARHLVLTSRRDVDAATNDLVGDLTTAGINVSVIRADVSDPSDVDQLLGEIANSMPPIRGIIHCAGVLDDGILIQQSWDRFEKVMMPKVQGSWNLHSKTLGMPLDFFVCFSSVASLVGNAGQGSYAAGNAFVDALAHYRHASRLPALSINWGPWGEIGMAARLQREGQRQLARLGFRAIDLESGLRAFGAALRHRRPQVAFVPGDWSQFVRANPSSHLFLEKVARVKSVSSSRKSDFLDQFNNASNRRELLTKYVRSLVGQVLGIDNGDSIEPRARLFDLGLESLLAVELRSRFEEGLGRSLRSSLVFDYPTIDSLVDYLLGVMDDASTDARAEPDPSSVSKSMKSFDTHEELKEMDEDEIAAQLEKELSAIEDQES